MAPPIKQVSQGGLRALKEFLRNTPLMKSLPETKEFSTWHGTPRTFMPEPEAPLGKFRNDKINTGEGAQAFSYGHYTTGAEDLARSYRDTLARQKGSKGPSQTKKELAAVAPDMAYLQPIRFGSAGPMGPKSGEPGHWLASADAENKINRIQTGPGYSKRFLAANPQLANIDEPLAGALSQVAGMKDRSAWLPEEVLDPARKRFAALRQIQSAEDFRRALPNLPEETYKAMARDLKLPADPTEVTKALWFQALGAPEREYYRKSDLLNKRLQVMMGGDTSGVDAATKSWAALVKEAYGLKPEYGTAQGYRPYSDKQLLGHNGIVDFTRQMSDPTRLQELRAHFGIGDVNMLPQPSVYRVQQNMSPADLWFLDSPLIGQQDDFIREFQQAGKAMTPAFGERTSLGSTGHENYSWLKKAPKAPGGLRSEPGSKSRNAEITDFLQRGDIPGAMFLRGGHRDLDTALQRPFDPFDYNFSVYDPELLNIIERKKHGGSVQTNNGR